MWQLADTQSVELLVKNKIALKYAHEALMMMMMIIIIIIIIVIIMMLNTVLAYIQGPR